MQGTERSALWHWFAAAALTVVHPGAQASDSVCVASLDALSIGTLAQTRFAGQFRYVEQLGSAERPGEFGTHYSRDGTPVYDTHVLAYRSQGLRVYARLDVPAVDADNTGPAPVLVYGHGWVGEENAPEFQLAHDTTSMSGEIIDRFVDAGFAVLSPGYRGHGTFGGRPAEGLEYLSVWDSGGSYLTPSFYALDILNAVAALPSLHAIDALDGASRINTTEVVALGHSQGGDAMLTALAIAANAPDFPVPIRAGSLWAGCIGDKLEQIAVYKPMAATRRAFTAGDGRWYAGATSPDGQTNPEFVFPWPQVWTAVVDANPAREGFSAEWLGDTPVAEVIAEGMGDLYTTINQCVDDIDGATFTVVQDPAPGDGHIQHDPRVTKGLHEASPVSALSSLTVPLQLHASDRDYYSLPRWNQRIAQALRAEGVEASFYLYPGTDHLLRATEAGWYTPPGTTLDIDDAVQRDAAFFRRHLSGDSKDP